MIRYAISILLLTLVNIITINFVNSTYILNKIFRLKVNILIFVNGFLNHGVLKDVK